MADQPFKVGDFVETDDGHFAAIAYIKTHDGVSHIFLANGQRKRPDQLKKSS
jgi:hypothetical protein